MIFKPPQNIAHRDFTKPSIFLAGSIEMGTAEDWQSKSEAIFNSFEFNVFNPRRNDWDSSWVQEYTNPQFYQQVNWELDAMDAADYILMYFSQDTKSPITLLELGLFAKEDKRLVVVCPDGFWRKGNVDIVCQRYLVPIADTLDEAIRFIINHNQEQQHAD
jgi:hypothetical protein